MKIAVYLLMFCAGILAISGLWLFVNASIEGIWGAVLAGLLTTAIAIVGIICMIETLKLM